MKYRYSPQPEATFKLDRTSPEIDWTVSEPEKVTVLMPSSRFLLPRDSLSKIVTGQMNWNTMEQHSRRQLLRTCSTESSPPVLTTTHTTEAGAATNYTSLGAANIPHFRRSPSPFPSYHPCTNIFFPDGVVPSAGAGAGAGEEPPSYTAVFTGDTETVTPPPTYSNIQDTV